MPAFQFYATIDGLALQTEGLVYGYVGTTTLPQAQYVTPLGLGTGGLAIGKSDFWHYFESPEAVGWTGAETIVTPSWASAETIVTPTWVSADL